MLKHVAQCGGTRALPACFSLDSLNQPEKKTDVMRCPTLAVVAGAEAVIPQSSRSTHDAAYTRRAWPLVARVTAVRYV